MLARVRSFFSSSGNNYAYVCARVRALKTYLLPEDEYPKLLARDVHELARALQEGRYKEAIDMLAGEVSGAELVERATRFDLGREFRRVLSWCQGEPRLLMGLYFERYDVHNTKTVLRGARARAPRAETAAALIPVGVAPEAAYETGLAATTLDDAITALAATPYGAVVTGMRGQPLGAIENALDVAYYARLLRSVPPGARANEAFLQFLRREIDVVNLKLIVRVKHAAVAEHELVPGGREITDELARRLSAAPWPEVQTLVDETSYGPVLKGALADYQGSRDLNAIVTALDRHHLAEAASFGHLYPLSILPIVDYVLNKQREVDRIRIIAVGKRAQLATADIEALVAA